jgi:hypothetical protein
MYPPTFHPGVYDKPEREPFIDVGNLFRLLFHPKEAFEDLYDHTTSTQGWILALVFIIVSAVIGLAVNLAVLGTIDLPEDVDTGFTTTASGLSSIVGIFTNILYFFITAWLFHTLVKDRARRPDLNKTIGMMGYAKFPMFIIGILIALLTPLLLSSLGFDPDDPEAAIDAIGGICGISLAILGLSILGFVWSLWVHSQAQSVANDMESGSAMGWMFLTWFLVGLLSMAIGAVVGIATGTGL